MGRSRRTIKILKRKIDELEREVSDVAFVAYMQGVEAERERHMRFLSTITVEPKVAVAPEFL